MMRYLLILFILVSHLFALQLDSLQFTKSIIDDSTGTTSTNLFMNHVSMDQQEMKNQPLKDLKDIIALFPSVIKKDDNLFLQGGESDEIGYELNGFSIRDAYTGDISFRVPKQILSYINLETGLLFNNKNLSKPGLVSAQVRSGTNDFEIEVEGITDNLTFKEKDNFFDGKKFLGTYSYGYNEINTSAGGSLFDNNLSYFGNINYLFKRDRSPEFYPGIDKGWGYDYDFYDRYGVLDSVFIYLPAGPVKGNSEEDLSLVGNINYKTEDTRVSLLMIYSNNRKEISQYPWASISNSRVGITTNNYFLSGLNIEHIFSKYFSGQIKISYTKQLSKTFDPYLEDNIWLYGDNYANKEAGVGWVGKTYLGIDSSQYVFPSSLNINGLTFPRQNYIDVDYQKLKTEKYNLAASLNFSPSQNLRIGIGGTLNTYVLRHWEIYSPTIYLAHQLRLYSEPPYEYNEIEMKKYILSYSPTADVIGYNIIGNETNSKGLYAPAKPVLASLYNDYSFSWEGGNAYLNFQYDFFDMDTWKLNSYDYYFYLIIIDEDNFEEYYDKVKTKHYFSPRISISQKVDNNKAIVFSFGKYVQQQPFSNIYMGYNKFVEERNRGNYYPQMVNPDAEPKTTYNWQLAFLYSEKGNEISVTGYKRNTINGIFDFIPYRDSLRNPSNNYRYCTPIGLNGKRTEALGLTLSTSLRLSPGNHFVANVTYQDVESDESFEPTYGYRGLGMIDFVPANHGSNFFGNIAYTFNSGEINYFESLNNITCSISANFNNGFPFALEQSLGNWEYDNYYYHAVDFNSENTSWQYVVNLFVAKHFELWEDTQVEISISITNLLNKKNIESVYTLTGEPDDSGVERTWYAGNDLYKDLIVAYNGYYGKPRQINLGFRIVFN